MEKPDDWQPDEHQIYLNLMNECEEAYKTREHYKRFGPGFVLISGVVFLFLIFTQDSKVEFLTLWVVTVFYTAALMIKAEYKYHRYRKLLGMSDDEENPEEENSEESEDVPSAEGGEVN